MSQKTVQIVIIYFLCRETKKKLLQALKGVNVEDEDVSLYADGGWD